LSDDDDDSNKIKGIFNYFDYDDDANSKKRGKKRKHRDSEESGAKPQSFMEEIGTLLN
jgi:hypothetical protein